LVFFVTTKEEVKNQERICGVALVGLCPSLDHDLGLCIDGRSLNLDQLPHA
jgi:hypothetical protein